MQNLKNIGNEQDGSNIAYKRKNIGSDNSMAKKITFERGKIARAERDVLAEELEEHEDHIKTPYALATYQIKRGAKLHGKKKAIAREFAEQKRMKKQSKIKRMKKYWK